MDIIPNRTLNLSNSISLDVFLITLCTYIISNFCEIIHLISFRRLFQGWGPACSDDRELVNITPELQNRILEIQNKVRNQQAMGKTPNYGPAVRMSTLVWDDELAKMAEFNARLCKYGHDPCRNTGKIIK